MGGTPVHELLEYERLGVISRDEGGLFPIMSTTNRITAHIEAECVRFRATHVRTPKGWALLLWEAPGKALDRVLEAFRRKVSG